MRCFISGIWNTNNGGYELCGWWGDRLCKCFILQEKPGRTFELAVKEKTSDKEWIEPLDVALKRHPLEMLPLMWNLYTMNGWNTLVSVPASNSSKDMSNDVYKFFFTTSPKVWTLGRKCFSYFIVYASPIIYWEFIRNCRSVYTQYRREELGRITGCNLWWVDGAIGI